MYDYQCDIDDDHDHNDDESITKEPRQRPQTLNSQSKGLKFTKLSTQGFKFTWKGRGLSK